MIINILFLLLAVPIGFLISNLAKDELKSGRKWFLLLSILSTIGAIASYFLKLNYLPWVFAFIFIVAGISYLKNTKLK